MSPPEIPIEDRAVEVEFSEPQSIGRGFFQYHRFEVTVPRPDELPLHQRTDLIRGGRVVVVIPVDIERDEVVLLRQFRFTGHLVTGKGEMIEFPAGRVDPKETTEQAAARECLEEIGIAPSRLVELYSVLPTSGITDEYITYYLGFLDASKIHDRGGLAAENEDIRPFAVSIAKALAALTSGKVANGHFITAMQWLAINRGRLCELADDRTASLKS